MKTVEIIKGTYGYRPGLGKSTKPIYKGKTVDLPDAEADRLVSIGVAEYVSCAGMPMDGVATLPADTGCDEPGNDLSDNKYGGGEQETGADGDGQDDIVLDIEDSHFTKESVMQMTRKNMEKMAVDLGIDPKDAKACKNKDELAELIAGVEVAGEEDENGEQPPDLTPEGPVA